MIKSNKRQGRIHFMRTIIWFIYFWGYLLAVLPKTHRMKKLTQAGKIEERDAIVTEAVQKWSRRLLKLAGVKVTVQGLENIPEGAVVFVSNHQGLFDIPTLLGYLDRPHGLIAKKEAEKNPYDPHMDALSRLYFSGP